MPSYLGLPPQDPFKMLLQSHCGRGTGNHCEVRELFQCYKTRLGAHPGPRSGPWGWHLLEPLVSISSPLGNLGTLGIDRLPTTTRLETRHHDAAQNLQWVSSMALPPQHRRRGHLHDFVRRGNSCCDMAHDQGSDMVLLSLHHRFHL